MTDFVAFQKAAERDEQFAKDAYDSGCRSTQQAVAYLNKKLNRPKDFSANNEIFVESFTKICIRHNIEQSEKTFLERMFCPRPPVFLGVARSDYRRDKCLDSDSESEASCSSDGQPHVHNERPASSVKERDLPSMYKSGPIFLHDSINGVKMSDMSPEELADLCAMSTVPMPTELLSKEASDSYTRNMNAIGDTFTETLHASLGLEKFAEARCFESCWRNKASHNASIKESKEKSSKRVVCSVCEASQTQEHFSTNQRTKAKPKCKKCAAAKKN